MNRNFYIYSLLAFPLSFIGLPIYVHIANFYVNKFYLSVSMIGILIFVSRFIDMVQDPIIGQISDNLIKKGVSRKKIINFNIPFLALSFYFLFNPPNLNQTQIMIWFVLSLILVYTFFSIITINYNAIAAEIATDYNSRTKITTIREFVGLIGILSASILPFIISKSLEISQENSLSIISTWFFLILILFTFLTNKSLDSSPNKDNLSSEKLTPNTKLFTNIPQIFSDKIYRIFLLIFFINSIAVSLPASTFLFFVEDVLKVKDQSGIFLLVYFSSSALAMPLWNYCAKKFGKENAWMISIFLSIITFFWAFFLDSQTYQQFYIICFSAGLMLGADLSIPPSILADIVNQTSKTKEKISSYFSFYNTASKLALACASGFSLIFLGLFDFRQNTENNNESLFYLSLIYALIPCLIKIIVIVSILITKKKLNLRNQ